MSKRCYYDRETGKQSMRRYELTFITRGELAQNQINEQAETVLKNLEKSGGKLIDRYDWGLLNLAYPIKRHKKGFYTTLLFDGAQNTVREVESKLRLSDAILRFLSVCVPSTQDSIRLKEKNNASSQE